MADIFCQQCRTPLKLHGSLQNLNPAAVNLLQGMPTCITAPIKILTNFYLQVQRASQHPQEPPRKRYLIHGLIHPLYHPETQQEETSTTKLKRTMHTPLSDVHTPMHPKHLHLSLEVALYLQTPPSPSSFSPTLLSFVRRSRPLGRSLSLVGQPLRI